MKKITVNLITHVELPYVFITYSDSKLESINDIGMYSQMHEIDAVANFAVFISFMISKHNCVNENLNCIFYDAHKCDLKINPEINLHDDYILFYCKPKKISKTNIADLTSFIYSIYATIENIYQKEYEIEIKINNEQIDFLTKNKINNDTFDEQKILVLANKRN